MGFGEFDALSVQNVLLRASSSRWEEVGSWESWRFQGDVSVVLSAGMAFSSADLATSSAAAAPSARIGGRSTGRVWETEEIVSRQGSTSTQVKNSGASYRTGVLWTSLSTDMAKGSCCDRMFFKSGGQSIYDSESL
mmetsp:Transcript_43935/g.171662  ORF Transcript_43935/g.171662 Transcript_43935/m.171662 type:complete len:136 (-) Transcript_43935:487-894(-)